MTATEKNKFILISSVNGKCYCADNDMSHDMADAKIFTSREDAEMFIADNEYYALDIVQLTYDIVFNDDTASNNEGLNASLEHCRNHIQNGVATKDGYYADYGNGSATIACNQTGESVEMYSCETGELITNLFINN